MEQLEPLERPIFAKRLSPHRSLSAAHFRILIAVVGGVSLLTSLPFFLVGAWPVVGFMGLDVALLYWAFRANFNAAAAYEHFLLTALELRLARVSATGQKAEWHFHPSWVRLVREEHEEFGTQRLALVSRGQSVEVAAFLGPAAKAAFADEFSKALTTARRGPRFRAETSGQANGSASGIEPLKR
jgi:uncharacterized membrane protein